MGDVGLVSCQGTEMGIEGLHKEEIPQRQVKTEKIRTNSGRSTSNH